MQLQMTCNHIGSSSSCQARHRFNFAHAAGNNYGELSIADRKSAGYCYDIATLQPVYNPLAVPIPEDLDIYNASLAASPLTTILVFGNAFGMPWSSQSLLLAKCSKPSTAPA